jgi:hypothetical protein
MSDTRSQEEAFYAKGSGAGQEAAQPPEVTATFLTIPVTAETHAMFWAQADEASMGGDGYVRRLLELEDRYGWSL